MLRDLLFYQLCLELLLHFIQHVSERTLLRKSIAHFDPAEEISHRLRRKKIPQIHRNHQRHRFFLPASGNLLMNGADQHGGKKRGNRSSVRTGFRQDFFHRYGYLQDLHIVMGQFFSLQAYCGRILFLFSLSLGRIILRKAVFFLIPRSDLFFFRDPGDPVIRMRQDQIILHKLQKKIHGARSVGQRVEHFEIDPVLIVCNFKQQRFFVRDIQPAAGRFFLFRRQWPDISPLQIEPEQALPENRLKQRVFLHCLIQGRLKDLRLYRFFQFTVKPENPCIVLPGHKRKGQSRIIQFSPFRISFFHFTQHPSLLCQHCFYTLLFSRNPLI